MYELKTKVNDNDVKEFLFSISDEQKKEDSLKILDLFQKHTKDKPKMWGNSIIGFGDYTYTNSTKKEFKWFKTGFSPRKQALTLYVGNFENEEMKNLLKKLGPYKTGKSCLYITKLEKIDIEILEKIIKFSINSDSYCC